MADATAVVAQTKKKLGMTAYLNSDAVKENIMQVIGAGDYNGFVTAIVSAVQVNKDLAECTNQSILSAALLGQTLKLSPSPQLGQYYMVKYENKGVKEAVFQLGYKGYLQLAMRSGQYKRMNTIEVREGELIGFNPFTEEIEFAPFLDAGKREKAKVIGYYAFFELNNGFRKEMYWTKEKMGIHAKTYSKGYKKDLSKGTSFTFWSTNFDEMAKKTMLRQLISKWGIMSTELKSAFDRDEAVIREDGSPDYVDNTVDVESVEVDVVENANKTPVVEEADFDNGVIPDFMKG